MPICELRFRSVSRIGMPAHRSSYEGFSGWLGWWEPPRAPVLERYLLSAFQQQCYNLLWLFSQGLELQGGLGSLTELCWESWEWLHHSCYNPENIMCFTFWKKAFIRVGKQTRTADTQRNPPQSRGTWDVEAWPLFESWGLKNVFERSSSHNLGLGSLKKTRLADWLTLLCKHIVIWLWICWATKYLSVLVPVKIY